MYAGHIRADAIDANEGHLLQGITLRNIQLINAVTRPLVRGVESRNSGCRLQEGVLEISCCNHLLQLNVICCTSVLLHRGRPSPNSHDAILPPPRPLLF